MSSFDLNIDLGKAFGRHKINVVVEHTGLGHIVFFARLPLKKEERLEIPATSTLIGEIEAFKDALDDYSFTAAKMVKFGLDPDQTILLNVRTLPVIKNLNLFTNKILFNINELKQALDKIFIAARVEFTRSGSSVLNW